MDLHDIEQYHIDKSSSSDEEEEKEKEDKNKKLTEEENKSYFQKMKEFFKGSKKEIENPLA